MTTLQELTAGGEPADTYAQRESQLQRVLIAYIVSGLLYKLMPGTLLGIWNLISVSNQQHVDALRPAWLQAHGHAQIFGWIGTFILGIGFYSLSFLGFLLVFVVFCVR